MRMPRTFSCWLIALVMALVPASTGLPAQSQTTDPGAGGWQMIGLSSATQFTVAPPTQTSSFDYQTELSAIKNAQSRLTADQRKAIDYWSAGGVVRWNEIMLGLVSRFNLPPMPNADNSYPVPDANNPFADPQFPFANPPYAARAYSYVAVAQFDALKAAWHFKYLYNRPAPWRVDSGVKALMPATDLPAYPSEDAVMSGVNAELLKLLFPAAVEEITLKAARAAAGSAPVGQGHRQRYRRRSRSGPGRRRRLRGQGRHRWDADRRRLSGAVAGARRRRDRAR